MTQITFQFSVPKNSEGFSDMAYLARVFGALSSRLVQEQRTRTIHPDGRRENVAEHALMLAKVAPELLSVFIPSLTLGEYRYSRRCMMMLKHMSAIRRQIASRAMTRR